MAKSFFKSVHGLPSCFEVLFFSANSNWHIWSTQDYAELYIQLKLPLVELLRCSGQKRKRNLISCQTLSSYIQTTHHLPWGQSRAGWSGPGRSCGWAGWCRSGPPLSPGCSAGSVPSCFPSPPASWKLLLIRMPPPRRCGLGRTFGRHRISPNSAQRDPSGRPAPSGPSLPLEEGGEGIEREFRTWWNMFDLIKQGY